MQVSHLKIFSYDKCVDEGIVINGKCFCTSKVCPQTSWQEQQWRQSQSLPVWPGQALSVRCYLLSHPYKKEETFLLWIFNVVTEGDSKNDSQNWIINAIYQNVFALGLCDIDKLYQDIFKDFVMDIWLQKHILCAVQLAVQTEFFLLSGDICHLKLTIRGIFTFIKAFFSNSIRCMLHLLCHLFN